MKERRRDVGRERETFARPLQVCADVKPKQVQPRGFPSRYYLQRETRAPCSSSLARPLFTPPPPGGTLLSAISRGTRTPGRTSKGWGIGQRANRLQEHVRPATIWAVRSDLAPQMPARQARIRVTAMADWSRMQPWRGPRSASARATPGDTFCSIRSLGGGKGALLWIVVVWPAD